MKVLIVFGTRPETIKMAPVIKRLEAADGFESIVCVSAQHREMLDHTLDIFDIHPHIDLNIMRDDQNLFDVTSRIILGMHEVLKKEMPDIVLVQGDTTTAFAAALSSFYAMIPIGHVEAGLRTGNLYAPFPEEANRALVGRLADYHFAPTEKSKNNLLAENIHQDKIFITGNTVIDALLMIKEKVANENPLIWAEQFGAALPVIMDHSRRIILVTGHRRESFGQGFQNICKALSLIADRFKEVDIIYPVHLNPNVRKPVTDMLKNNKNIYLIDPMQYAPFVYLLNRSHLILTDSGGIQEEAPSLGKPVLVMREVTERPEAVEAGTAILVGTEHEKIFENTSRLLTDGFFYNKMARAHNPFGDGKTAERIVDILFRHKISNQLRYNRQKEQ